MEKTKKEDGKLLTKDFVGYGHYKINVAIEDGRVLSAVTGDTELIYRLNSQLESEQEQARSEAIEFVLLRDYLISFLLLHLHASS